MRHDAASSHYSTWYIGVKEYSMVGDATILLLQDFVVASCVNVKDAHSFIAIWNLLLIKNGAKWILWNEWRQQTTGTKCQQPKTKINILEFIDNIFLIHREKCISKSTNMYSIGSVSLNRFIRIQIYNDVKFLSFCRRRHHQQMTSLHLHIIGWHTCLRKLSDRKRNVTNTVSKTLYFLWK